MYVSDKPGGHDFHLLRRLVLPDGRLLRALLPGRPTDDTLLADVLRARGATVDYVTCYHRSPPVEGAAPLNALWAAQRLDALTVSSSEGLRNLVALLDAAGRAHLRTTPVFVPHERIAEVAGTLDLQRLILTGPADAGIIAGLCAYNWQQS